ncbi:MLT2 protein [Gonium pectorale]|uniref:MLT2 protein n=1 Tax=Gonium pectorale TaxID=33097 RepID=A0A150GFM1_GONPE|nr:MLT2 protein [Gonium pectorale]|eukprot:KXZ48120.1 MLT2 protein [Gonium pectorale]
MPDTKREISGFILSKEKFASHVAALASPDCTVAQLRLFHNEPSHSAAVLQALQCNSSVSAFDIYEVDSAAASALAALLAATPRLTSLSVHHLHSHEAVSLLAQGLAANRTLTHLHISQLDARGVAAVATALSAWATAAPSTGLHHPVRLQQLRLDKCAVTAEAAAALAAALGSQAGALAQLSLVECDLGDAAAAALLGAPGWEALAAGGGLLSTLDLSSCHVGPQGAALLGRFLALSGTLSSLSLANNRSLGCAGAAALAPGVAASRRLRRLDLSGCGVGVAGVTALAAALRGVANADASDASAAAPPPPPPLQHLLLADNSGAAAGLLALLQALSGPSPCGLQTLSLDRNHIRGVDLAQALGLPVQAAPSLRSPAAAAPPPPAAPAAPLPLVTAALEQLSLAGNALWDAGAAALAAVLAVAPALAQLDLRENGIADAGVTALLPLILPASPRRGSAGGGASAGGGCRPGLCGLLLDGNRLHNAGGQALLDAVTAAPALWRFSAEGNKLTDPALRLSLTQLSQLRAARHSQLVVLGRQYSSSSSSASDDHAAGNGPAADGRRSSGGGGGGSSAPARRGASGGGAGDGGCSTPMDVDEAPGGGSGAGAGGGAPGQQQRQQLQYSVHKHRLEERSDGGAGSSGDERPPLRNVAARGDDAPLPPSCGGVGGMLSGFAAVAGTGFGGGGGGYSHSSAMDVACGGDAWRSSGSVPHGTARSGGASSGGGASVDGSGYCYGCYGPYSGDPCGGAGGCCGGGAPSAAAPAGRQAALLSSSPPPAVCFVTAATGVGGACSVGVSQRAGAAGSGAGDVCAGASHTPSPKAAPQQILPPSRRPRYKPLTPEQQRLFDDF